MDQYAKTVGKKIRENSWIILLIISMGYVAAVLNMQGIKTLMPFIREELVLTRAHAGLYSTFFFLSATGIAIISGKIVDLIGPRKGLVLGTFCMGVLMILHAFVPGYTFMLALAFVAGVAFSMVTPSANKGVIELVTPKRRAMSMGIVHAGGGIGGLIAALLIPYIGAEYGWRFALFLSGGAAVFAGLLIFQLYRTGKESQPHEKALESQQNEETAGQKETGAKDPSSFKEEIVFLIKNKYLLSFGAIGMIFGAGMSSIGTHFTIFARQDLGMAEEMVGIPLAFFQIGGMAGQTGWGYINDNFFAGNRRKGLIVQGFCIALIMFLNGIFMYEFVPGVIFTMVMSFLLGFFVLGIPSVYFTAVGELVPKRLGGTATSLALVYLRTGVIIVPPVFGYVADIFDSYQFSWFLLGFLAFVLTLVFSFTSKGAMKYMREVAKKES